MSTYNLSQTAAEIDSAIGKVHNADTSPTQGSTSMVTSGGVYTAVTNIGASALPITTEAQGIANYDNDDKVPTNAAVKDYVDSRTGGVATYSAPDFNDLRSSVQPINISEGSDPYNIGSLSSGVITISAGFYFADLTLNAGNRYIDYNFTYYISINNSVNSKRIALCSATAWDYQAPYPSLYGDYAFFVPVTTTISIDVDEVITGGRHYMNNFAFTLVKVS